MSADAHQAVWQRAALLLRDAAQLVANPSECWPVRARAAELCRVLSLQVARDEAVCADTMRAAHASVEIFPVLHDLVLAAVELAPDPSRLILPMRRLCAHAHDVGYHDTLVVTLVTMLELDGFDGAVPPIWLVAACSVDGEADYWLRRLVRRWVERFGAEHEGVRAIIRERADVWFPTRRFRLDVLRAMHAAEPTAAGWIALASRRSEMDGPLGIAFGDRHGDAVATMGEALLRTLPAATLAAVEGWLAELST